MFDQSTDFTAKIRKSSMILICIAVRNVLNMSHESSIRVTQLNQSNCTSFGRNILVNCTFSRTKKQLIENKGIDWFYRTSSTSELHEIRLRIKFWFKVGSKFFLEAPCDRKLRTTESTFLYRLDESKDWATSRAIQMAKRKAR